MNDKIHDKIHGEIFYVLKQKLRARKMSYADLAKALDVSEPTIKRIFSQGDCKLTRLVEICDILEVSMSDVVSRSSRNESASDFLPLKVETAFAENLSLFYLYQMLRNDQPQDEIMQKFNLSEGDMFVMGNALEKLELVDVLEGGRIRLREKGGIKVRNDGPLGRAAREINLRFTASILKNAHEEDITALTMSRRILPDTARQIGREIVAMREKIAIMARQDQLVAPSSDLKTYKLCVAWGELDFPLVYPIKSRQEQSN